MLRQRRRWVRKPRWLIRDRLSPAHRIGRPNTHHPAQRRKESGKKERRMQSKPPCRASTSGVPSRSYTYRKNYLNQAYVGLMDQKIYALDPATGVDRPGWPYLTGGYVFSSPAIAADGSVYVGSADGKLYALNPNGSQKRPPYNAGA